MRAGSKRTASPPAAVMRGFDRPLGLDLGKERQDRFPGVQRAPVHRDRDVIRRRRTSSSHGVPQRVEVPLLDRGKPLRAHVVHDAGRVSALGPPGLAATCISDVSIRRAPDRVARSMTVQQFSIMPVQRHCPAQTNTHRTGSDQIWEQEVAGSNPASPESWARRVSPARARAPARALASSPPPEHLVVGDGVGIDVDHLAR